MIGFLSYDINKIYVKNMRLFYETARVQSETGSARL
jgi:hypothetical protein